MGNDGGGANDYIAHVSEGVLDWSATHGNGAENVNEIVLTADGGYFAAGHTFNYSVGEADMYLLKTDDHGDIAPPE